jgi:hypothetical protein
LGYQISDFGFLRRGVQITIILKVTSKLREKVHGGGTREVDYLFWGIISGLFPFFCEGLGLVQYNPLFCF